MRVIFFANSFKNTISNDQVLEVYGKFFKENNFKIVPISDGGDGFLNLIRYVYPDSKIKYFLTLSPEEKKIKVKAIEHKDTLFLESARIIGFSRIKDIERSPEKRTSAGIGIILKKTYKKYKKIVIGIGGTTTFDLGCGIFEELNYKVKKFSKSNIPIKIEKDKKSISIDNLYGICDVRSSLDGPYGASFYLEQKGVEKKNIILYRKIFDRVAKEYKVSSKRYLGSGGGLGFAVKFLNGKLLDNFSYLEKILKLKEMIKKNDLIVLNEGKFDNQTFNGKINGEIVKLGIRFKKKIYFITAKVDLDDPYYENYVNVIKLDKNPKDYKIEFEKKVKLLKEIING